MDYDEDEEGGVGAPDDEVQSFASFNDKNRRVINHQQSHLLKMISAEGALEHANQNLEEVPRTLLAATFKGISGLNLQHNYIVTLPDSLP